VSVQLSAAVAAFTAAVDALATADPHDTAEVYRLGECEQLLTGLHRLQAVIARRLALIDTADTAVTDTGRATRSWLIEVQQLNPGLASRWLRVARGLGATPVLDAAFSAGTVTLDHAAAIVTALASVPPVHRDTVETALVTLATDLPATALGGHVETLLVACGVEPDADAAAVRRLERRGLTISPTFDGLRAVSGLLPPEVGETLELALTALTAHPDPDDDRSFAQRRHDAIGELATHYLTHADLPAINGERPRIVVTLDHDTLTGQLQRAGHLATGDQICPATARRLACDAEILPAVLGSKSQVLDLATPTRSFPTAVRRAAWINQHGRCAYPRCQRPPADCHHITWWTHGGPSTLTNAAWLCAFHHWLVHERGWTMHRQQTGFTFTSPHGRTITSVPPPRPPEVASAVSDRGSSPPGHAGSS
jgi:hypothetical protein